MTTNKKWTNQELFDFCKKEFLSPEFKQCLADDGDVCIYYNPVDNNSCIMGKTMSIEDAKLVAASECADSSISFLMEKKHPAVDHLSEINSLVATRLQLVHDRFNATGLMVEANLKAIARTFDLVYEH